MIIFINGPFGVGKTSTATEVVQRLPNAMLLDPEEIGSFLRRLMGARGAVADYKDLPLWRVLTVEMAGHLHSEFDCDLVIPMSVYRHPYFDEIVGGLQKIDSVVLVQLVAERATLKQRIVESTDVDALDWRLQHLTTLSSDFPNPAFGQVIPTDGRTVVEVAQAVVDCAQQSIQPGV